ncbi:hypothetical protein CDAR_557861 [Caerostris darwini]|uniref:Uncharacterized protein n=1 Tax=Caerostris darwini TaxID=1538125 RepID=A0AAV4RAB0_9ARAC|nr:hypothetical protein CDAR_557861 [Caerostris darwini]
MLGTIAETIPKRVNHSRTLLMDLVYTDPKPDYPLVLQFRRCSRSPRKAKDHFNPFKPPDHPVLGSVSDESIFSLGTHTSANSFLVPREKNSNLPFFTSSRIRALLSLLYLSRETNSLLPPSAMIG